MGRASEKFGGDGRCLNGDERWFVLWNEGDSVTWSDAQSWKPYYRDVFIIYVTRVLALGICASGGR
jgi:hypothetical protein